MAEPEHAHSHHEHQGHEHPHHEPAHHQKRAKAFEVNNNILFAILVIAILAITIYARLGLIGSQGLFEPDGFFYYSVVRATLMNHLSEPQYLGISGFPMHNFIGEAPGLPYITVIGYLLLGWTGASALAIMRYLPVFVAIIEVLLAYLIAKELSNSRLCGLLGMFFIAISAGNIARTAALVYRGDTFIGIPIMLAIFLMLKGLKLKDTKKIAIVAVLAAFVLSTGSLIWNGSPFIIAVYMLSLLLLMLYAFASWKPDLAKSVLIFTLALFVEGILAFIYAALKGARPGLALSGTNFIIFYIPLLIIAVAVFYAIKKEKTFGVFGSPLGRWLFIIGVVLIVALSIIRYIPADIALVVLLLITVWQAFARLKVPKFFGIYLIGIIVLGVLFSGFLFVAHGSISTIATSAGVSISGGTSTAIGATTQELQKPTYQFLFASFTLALYLGPIAVVLFLLFNRRIDGREEESKQILTVGFIVLLSYLLITAYLQFNAIRYNSLLSIPIALFAAYALYAVIEIGGMISVSKTDLKYVAAILVVIALALISFLWLRNIFTTGLQSHNLIYLIEGIGMIVMMAMILAYTFMGVLRNKPLELKWICLLAVFMALLFCASFSMIESYSSAQADGINPSFLAAMTWMKANTAANATVLALWPDGSVVEGWANRTSYMDSVGGENGERIYAFAQWLANDTPDTQYLSGIGNPQYIVARQYWLTELQGLIAEGQPANPGNYTFAVVGSIGTPEQNATAQLYFFGNGVYNITLINRNGGNTSIQNYSAYLGAPGQLKQYKMQRVTFYNTSNTRYVEFDAQPGSYQINYTLMLFYSGTQIQGALITTSGLYDSNLFRLVWLCTQYQCPYYANTSAKITPVYINNDTRIFKVNYG
jgi:hypothetical protein